MGLLKRKITPYDTSPFRSARRPYTFVTTEQFLVAFGLESLRDLPDREQLEDAGVVGEVPQVDFG